MTISSQITLETYTGNDIATEFDFGNKVFSASDLEVRLDDVVQTGGYQVQDLAPEATAKVVFDTPPGNGVAIEIESVIPVQQETNFKNQGRFNAEIHEDEFDQTNLRILKNENELKDKALWRKGGNNVMEQEIEMGGNRINNLGTPLSPTDAVRLKDLSFFDGGSLVIVVKQESQTLSSGQTTVTLVEFGVSQAAFYLNSFDVDNGRLVLGVDFNITGVNTIELIESYPDGTIITALQNEATEPGLTSIHERFVANAKDDSGTPDALYKVLRVHQQPNSGHSFADQSVFDPPVDAIAFASYDANTETVSGNDKEMDHMVAFQSRLNHFSTGDLNTYASLWAVDRIEVGAKCSNFFAFYDQGRTEGSTINHYSMVSDPAINGTVTNRIGVRVKIPRGTGDLTGINVGLYVEDIAYTGGATTYPIFIEIQSAESFIGCKMLFKNQCVFEGLSVFKTSPTPDTDAIRDLGASNIRWKTTYAVTTNSDILNLTPQATEPSGLVGSTLAMSDGTSSTNGFGTSGEGLYRKSLGGQWVFVG